MMQISRIPWIKKTLSRAAKVRQLVDGLRWTNSAFSSFNALDISSREVDLQSLDVVRTMEVLFVSKELAFDEKST